MSLTIVPSVLAISAGFYISSRAVNYVFFSPPDTTIRVRNTAEKLLQNLKEKASAQPRAVKFTVSLITDNLWFAYLISHTLIKTQNASLKTLAVFAFSVFDNNGSMTQIAAICLFMHMSRMLLFRASPDLFSRISPSYSEYRADTE